MLISTALDIATQVSYCLRAMGCRISLLAGANAGSIRYSSRLSGRHRLAAPIDGTDDHAVIEQIRGLHRSTPFDAVVPSDEPTTALLARIKDGLGIPAFPVPQVAVFERLVDKARFAEVCQELSLPVPKTVPLRSKADIDLESLIARLGLPLVIKPAREAGGTGLVVAETREAIRSRVIDNDAYAFAPLVAQEFIPGIDMGVSLVAHDGEILCIGTQIPHHGWMEFTECASLERAAEILCARLKYSGAANLDARFDEASGRAVFVECNPRFWVTIASALWCGTNFVEVGLRPRDPRAGRARVEPGRSSIRPLRFCLNLVRLKLNRKAFSRAQLAGLWLAMTDPLPLFPRGLDAIRGLISQNRAA